MDQIEYYKPVLVGALLYFTSLDTVDFNLLVKDYETKTHKMMESVCSSSPHHLGKYIEGLRNGTIKLKDGVSLDDFIEEEHRTLREMFVELAGSTIDDYYSGFNIEAFQKKKEEALLEYKTRVLDSANILLISDIQDDYDELVAYGFQHIDYFRSIIRADQYFAKHPEELEKYHVIIQGNQSIRSGVLVFSNIALAKKINETRNRRLVLRLARYDYPDHMELESYFMDHVNYRNWEEKEFTYQGMFDRFVENMFLNQILEKAVLKDDRFIPIEDSINPNRLPLPAKKSDLKVLYLEHGFMTRIIEELKLDITYADDYNRRLEDFFQTHLGDYDIIIASYLHLHCLLGLNIESTEQCKDTGRELTLLVCHDEFYWGVDTDLGDGVKIYYRFGGSLAPDSDIHSKEFLVLREAIEEDHLDNYAQSRYSKAKSIIEASVHFYHQALLQRGKPGISDLDFKTADDFDQEYERVYQNKQEKRKVELTPIRRFDSICSQIRSYLSYKNKGVIRQNPEGLNIMEIADRIKVENIYQGRTACVIIFPKDYKQDDLRILEIQTLTKKGTLSHPQTIGLYTSKYDGLEDIPRRPDEKEKGALSALEKKINVALKPLNDDAWRRQAQGTFGPVSLSLKRKNKKRN